jgi:hypothetical protein
MTTISGDEQLTRSRIDEAKAAHVWYALAACPLSNTLPEWPPDVFALTNVILDRTEAFRYALDPVGE